MQDTVKITFDQIKDLLRHDLTLDKLKEGLKIMSKKCPNQYALTGEVSLQYCVIGRVAYNPSLSKDKRYLGSNDP